MAREVEKEKHSNQALYQVPPEMWIVIASHLDILSWAALVMVMPGLELEFLRVELFKGLLKRFKHEVDLQDIMIAVHRFQGAPPIPSMLSKTLLQIPGSWKLRNKREKEKERVERAKKEIHVLINLIRKADTSKYVILRQMLIDQVLEEFSPWSMPYNKYTDDIHPWYYRWIQCHDCCCYTPYPRTQVRLWTEQRSVLVRLEGVKYLKWINALHKVEEVVFGDTPFMRVNPCCDHYRAIQKERDIEEKLISISQRYSLASSSKKTREEQPCIPTMYLNHRDMGHVGEDRYAIVGCLHRGRPHNKPDADLESICEWPCQGEGWSHREDDEDEDGPYSLLSYSNSVINEWGGEDWKEVTDRDNVKDEGIGAAGGTVGTKEY